MLTEVAGLAAQGIKEVTLLGQNVNAWRAPVSRDTEDTSAQLCDFAFLLECVHDIPGIERIRYTTSHPREMSQRIIDAYATLPKLVSRFASSRASRRGPCAGRDETRLYDIGIQGADSQVACRASRP